MNLFYNNKNAIQLFFFLIFLLCESGMVINAQTSLKGKITDEQSGEELIGGNIVVTKNGNFVQGETTDIDGNFSIRIDPGTYDVEVSYTGYPTQRIEGVIASAGVATKVDVQMKIKEGLIIGYIGGCGGYKIPLIKMEDMTTGHILTSEQIKNLPTRNIKKITTMTPGVSFSQ